MEVFCDELEWAMRLGVLMVAAGMVAGVVWQDGLTAAENEAPASAPATASQPATTAATRQHPSYFLVYSGAKDAADGKFMATWQASTVSVELHDTLKKSEAACFKLHQRTTEGRASVIFLDADGAVVSENHVYVIHSGEIVTVRLMAASNGGIEVIATGEDAEP